MASAFTTDRFWGVAGVPTPAFVERSESWRPYSARECVAGVPTPAFVERIICRSTFKGSAGVAGVPTPAFVERPPSNTGASRWPTVSPGSRPRPSLSARQSGRHPPDRRTCRRGPDPGLR